MKRTRGFTLVELAVVLVVMALLLGMLVIPLNTQVDQQRISDTQKQANLITEAIVGFAVASGRLPCPATATTPNTTAGAGLENKPGTTCALTEGVVPWATLGMPETDSWGRRFTYRVTPAFADDPAGGLRSSFALTDNGGITVKATSGGVDIATDVAAIVISHGKNGLGGYQTNGTQLAGAAGDELENSNAANAIFVSKVHEPAFDDLVVWISSSVLKSRMVAAGHLP